MTREEADFIGGMNMCDEISNEAYRKIMCHCEEQEPKTGHWIKTGYIDKVTCSICKRKMWNFWEVNDFNYCPNCGCRMVEPKESEVKE